MHTKCMHTWVYAHLGVCTLGVCRAVPNKEVVLPSLVAFMRLLNLGDIFLLSVATNNNKYE